MFYDKRIPLNDKHLHLRATFVIISSFKLSEREKSDRITTRVEQRTDRNTFLKLFSRIQIGWYSVFGMYCT